MHGGQLTAAYLIHARPFSETSLIVELLTESGGRIDLVAKGVKRKKSEGKGLLQPFRPLLVSWRGNASLKTLQRLESPTMPLPLTGERLFSGLYLNELLQRLLQQEMPYPEIYSAYHAALLAIARQEPIEPVLRQFEFTLLNALGVGFSLTHDVQGQPLAPRGQYRWLGQSGLIPAADGKFDGQALLAIAASDFSLEATRHQAKHLSRQALAPLLGHKPLHSRALFKRTGAKSQK